MNDIPKEAPETVTISRDEFEALQAQVARLNAAQSKFVKTKQDRPVRQRTYEPPEELRKRAMKRLGKGQTAGGTSRWLDTPEGRDSLPPEYRPVFQPGELVRINPDAPVWGMEGKTWGDILGDPKTKSDGIGEVVGTMYITETWEPKYKVSVQGLSTGSGDGFRESEMLPYE